MKWHAQAVHVARKDLHLARWPIAAYAAVVAAVTAGAAGWLAGGAATPLLSTIPVVALGMVLFALLVQADSPARSDARWVTLPLHPLAVFSAKLLAAAVALLALPLLGQLAGLLAHDVAPADLPGLLGESALTYGAWLAFAAAIAALTRNLLAFVVALALATLGVVLVMPEVARLLGPSGGSGPPSMLLFAAVTAAGMLLVLAHQYRTRDVRRGVWLAALVGAAVLLLLPWAAPRAAPSAPAAAGGVPRHLRPAALGIREVQVGPGARPTMLLGLAGASGSHRYQLVSPDVRIRMPDGSSTAVAVEHPYLPLNRPVLRLHEGVRWLGARPASPESVTVVPLDLAPAQREALASGGARLTLRGRLEVWEPRVRAELPLTVGVAAARDGQRSRITRTEWRDAAPFVEVQTSSVASAGSSGSPRLADGGWRPFPEYALVNRDRGEALAMGSGSAWGGSSGLGLVLPGPRMETGTLQLRPQDPWASGARIGDEWLGRARLLLVDWAPVGSEPVVIEGGGRRIGPPREP